MRATLVILFSIGFICLHAKAANHAKNIDSFMRAITVLVAENGHIIYKNGFGSANHKTGETFTVATPCYIGSLSKQFTAMGIMILKEQGKLVYEDPVKKYFPELPASMQPVTLRHLLTHTSGLAVFDDYPDMGEQDVFNILLKQETLRFAPGERFEYCNAGYTLLGMVIQKISGGSLNDFLSAHIFGPLGMKDTYVNQVSSRSRKRAVGYYLFGDEYNYDTFIGGAASVVSTVNDLYIWDQSLYAPAFIHPQTLEDAFTMQKKIGNDPVYGEKGYGFGWFVSGSSGSPIEQHDGGFAGFRSYIERQPKQHNSIIFISNIRHSLIGNIREAINNILSDKPYSIPNISYANWVIAESNKTSMSQAIEKYKLVSQSADSSGYYFSESEFNSLGYYLMNHKRLADAIPFFALNTQKNPASANAFDSLAEAYMNAGNKEQAIANYKKSLSLNPGNSNAADMIKKLGEGK